MFTNQFMQEKMMGPSALVILEELLQTVSLEKGMRVLDLACGKGITSAYLAKKYGVSVYAVDLWISATENYQTFKDLGVDDLVTPLNFDAKTLPFANEYFDAVVSVGSYHYFGNNDVHFSKNVLPLVKKGGIVALSFPGRKLDEEQPVPNTVSPFWDSDSLEMIHSLEWWRPKFEPYLQDTQFYEMACFDEAWKQWLVCDNEYATGDRAMIQVDNGQFLNQLALVGRCR